VIGLLPAHIIYCWIGARLNALLVNDPNPDFQALFGQFWAPMLGVFVLAVVLPFALKAVQGRFTPKRSRREALQLLARSLQDRAYEPGG
jgi:hypothetical protein